MADPTIRRDSRGTSVVKAQRALASSGFDPGPIDAMFGPLMEAAVIAFQTARGLALVDGVVGPETWRALPRSVVRLHVKVVVTPTPSIDDQIANMRNVYASARVGVELVCTETLTPAPALLNIDVGNCPFPCATTPTAAQARLFANRRNVGFNEIAAYFVNRVTSGGQGLNGCCAHAAGSPACIVSSTPSPWSLAHEIAHVLGVAHCDGPPPACACRNAGRLMTGCSTNSLVGTPTLNATEAARMDASPFTFTL